MCVWVLNELCLHCLLCLLWMCFVLCVCVSVCRSLSPWEDSSFEIYSKFELRLYYNFFSTEKDINHLKFRIGFLVVSVKESILSTPFEMCDSIPSIINYHFAFL